MAEYPPQTTCAFVDRTARKQHKCYDCAAQIQPGDVYIEDTYYCPYGNGRRFCRACARNRRHEENRWHEKIRAERAREETI